MRILVLLLVFTFPSVAFSWAYGGAEGRNRIGQIINFSSEDLHEISVIDPKVGYRSIKTYKMANECPTLIEWLDVKPSPSQKPHIECSKSGASPLAGATYTKVNSDKIKNVCGSPATVFKCISGCESKSVPLVIVEQPWEC